MFVVGFILYKQTETQKASFSFIILQYEQEMSVVITYYTALIITIGSFETCIIQINDARASLQKWESRARAQDDKTALIHLAASEAAKRNQEDALRR